MEPFEEELRTSLAAPIPSLSIDFEQRLESEIARRSVPLGAYGRKVLLAYGLASTFASTVVMRTLGLGWMVIAFSIILPLMVVAAASLAGRNATRT